MIPYAPGALSELGWAWRTLSDSPEAEQHLLTPTGPNRKSACGRIEARWGAYIRPEQELCAKCLERNGGVGPAPSW